MLTAHVDTVAHHVAGRCRTRRTVGARRTVLETGALAAFAAVFKTRTLATFLEARLALFAFAKDARAGVARRRGGARVFADDLQRLAFLGHHGQGGSDFLGADILLFGDLRHDVGEEIEAFGVEHFSHLGLEVGDALVGHVGAAGQGQRRDRRTGGALDGAQHADFARRDEQDGVAGTAGAAGAADTVHIGLGIVRNVVVDDVADARHVDAAGGNVGGNDDVQGAGLQLLDDAFAHLLVEVAVQGGGGIATGVQLVGQFDGGSLGAHEDDGGVEIILDFQDAGERVQLVHAADLPVNLTDRRNGGGGRLDLDFARLDQVFLGDTADLVRHGGREQRGLVLFRGAFENPLDVVDEAHAQHFVGFVENHGAQVVEVERLALQVVHDATRRADDDVGATGQLLQLDGVALAAVDRQHVEAGQVLGVALQGLGHLDGQFARRRQDQGLRLGQLDIDLFHQRQRESGGLAGAGLRHADHVMPVEQDGDALGLDGGGGFVTDFAEGLEQRFAQTERGKVFDSCRHMLFPFLVALDVVLTGDGLARWSGGLGDPDAAMPGNESMG